MATVRIEFETDNAAFSEEDSPGDCADIAESRRVLMRLCQDWHAGGAMFSTKLRDSNGNTVGRVEVTA